MYNMHKALFLYSRFRLFLLCLLCAAGTDPGRSARPAAKVCSVLTSLYNRPIRLFNGRLDSGWRSLALSVFQALWAKLEHQLLTARKSRHRSAGDPQSFTEQSYRLWNEQYFCWLLNIRNIQTQKGPEKPAQKWNGSKITSFLDFHFVYLAYINP